MDNQEQKYNGLNWATTKVGKILLAVSMLLAPIGSQAVISAMATQSTIDNTMSIFATFTNELRLQVGATQVNSVTFFSGSVCELCSSNGSGITLSQQSMGQMVSHHVPYPNFVNNIITGVESDLYYDKASVATRGTAAFRFATLMYGKTTNGVENLLAARGATGKTISDFYGNPERALADSAEKRVRDAIKYDPINVKLWNMLLDIYYSRAVAESLYAKELFVAAAEKRLQQYQAPAALIFHGRRAAEDEIIDYENVIVAYRNALTGYFQLLNDPLGVDVTYFGLASGIPLGYQIFQSQVPTRAAYSSIYFDPTSGTFKDVLATDQNATYDPSRPNMLYPGYKDMTLLFNLFADLSETIKEQTRLSTVLLYDGTTTGLALMPKIQELHQSMYIDGHALLGIFSEAALPQIGDPSGFRASVDRWSQAMNELTSIRGVIDGSTNFLGLKSDVLVFYPKIIVDPTSGQPAFEPTFDHLDSLLNGINGNLTVANRDFADATAAQVTLITTRDTTSAEMSRLRTSYDSRLRELMGAPRCTGSGTSLDCSGQCLAATGPCYNKPLENVGSALNLQYLTITRAESELSQAILEIENQNKSIEIEIERRGKEAGVNDAISQVYIDFGNRQAALTEQIAEARRKAAEAARDAGVVSGLVNSVDVTQTPVGTVVSVDPRKVISTAAEAYAANANIHMISTVGDLEAQKERLAALQNATINDLQNQILEANSAALVKNMVLRLASLMLEVTQARISLATEFARYKAIEDEVAWLEANMDQEIETLAGRYFADPSHRLIRNSKLQKADMSFAKAREWLFILTRSLEYKYNEPFFKRGWTKEDIFSLRNASELADYHQALLDFDLVNSISSNLQPYKTSISVAHDVFKIPRDGTLLPTGVIVDTNYIKAASLAKLNEHKNQRGDITIRFDTLRQIGDLFRGPNPSQPADLGTYLDKITSLKVVLKIAGGTTAFNPIGGFIRYGGESLVRNSTPGVVVNNPLDLTEPTRVMYEWTGYPVRYWRNVDNSWDFSSGVSTSIQIALGDGVVGLDSVFPNTALAERSVATSSWELTLYTSELPPTFDYNLIDDILISVQHTAATRQ